MKPTLPGTIGVTVKGKGYPVVLQRLHQQSVVLHSITSSGEEEIHFYISLHELSHIRKAVFKTGCKVSLKKGTGLAYELENAFKFRSFILWLLIAIVIVMASTRFLWSVEMQGATPEIRQEVEIALRKLGFTPGTYKQSLPLENQLSPVLYKEVEQLSWMGLEWQGTKLIVHLKEKKGSTQTEKFPPSHIVAAKKGTIQSMQIESGQAVENVNSVVKKGQLIVSGLVGREEDKKPVPSKGVVMAETWYEVNVTVPDKLVRETLTGNYKRKWSLQLFNWTTPPVSFSRTSFEEAIEETKIDEIKVAGVHLPAQKKTIHIYETERTNTKVDRETAREVALKVAREEVLSLIGGSGSIKQEKFLHEQIDNGKVKLTIYFQAIEDIAKVQPFSEETRE
ncbi:sporulation protein YqfD [Jeotgalibacillus sp. ET6]|uniref:sporulation protein YqfD n=1 Tax=Jeotgalibacillus sp. ET6 TaxID=3037260 RepID=UPI0024181967|nr:sporulation protein YqfD [Jeotgalibacillus sp. ET6]MDG5470852.1 sporulation protein YqfD [Jeotgalibacillus sp. ET6]